MRSSLRILLVALIAATPLAAQTPAFCTSNVYNDNVKASEEAPIARMHPLVSRGRYSGFVENQQWDAALRLVRDDATRAFVAGGVPTGDQEVFVAQLDATIDKLSRLPGVGTPTRASYIADSVRTVRFRVTPGVGGIVRLFANSPPAIVISGRSEEQMKALCWSANSADLILFRLGRELDAKSLARLANLRTAWSNYRTFGYTRQPLELFLFPGHARDTLPDGTQWIVGHLSLGGELRAIKFDSITANQSAVVELGHLWYYKNFTQYFGLSAIASLSSEHAVGYGGMIHFARGLRGGPVFRREGGKWATSAIVSTDLYGLLERSKRAVDVGFAAARGAAVLDPP
jgi:hypothetical protein